jgi:hypothetical protein
MGSKATSPRVPAARKIPRLGKFVKKKLPDGTERRVWVHQDFAPPDVVNALLLAGWNPRRFDETADSTALVVRLGPSELDGIRDWGDISNKIPDPVGVGAGLWRGAWAEYIAELDDVASEASPSEISEIDSRKLNNDIRHVVVDYVSGAQYQQSPREFRREVKSFQKALEAVVKKFPSAGSEHSEALNLKLEKLDRLALKKLGLEDDAPDVDLCRRYVLALLEANESIVADEAGGGADAARAKHLLVAGLARIYEEYTGRRPARGYDAYADKPHAVGPFFRFVTAVNELLPVHLRLSDIDSLIRAHLKQ